MLFVIFFLLYLAKFSVASILSSEEKILSFLNPLPQELLAIYELEKDNITFLIREYLVLKKLIKKGGNYGKLRESLQNLLCKLGIKDFLKAMMQDNSDYVLATFLSVYPRIERDEIFYPGILFPVSDMDPFSVQKLFTDFRHYIIKVLLKTYPLSQSDGKELLSIIKLFWYNKLEPLGKKPLNEIELKRERKFTEELFRILDNFLFNDPKFQIILEYNRLRRDIQEKKGRIENNKNSVVFFPSIMHFSFLAQQLKYRFKALSSSEFLNDLEWLASHDQQFLSYFFYFLLSVKINQKPPSIQHLAESGAVNILVWGKFSVLSFIILEEEKLFIFSKRTYTHEEQKPRLLSLPT